MEIDKLSQVEDLYSSKFNRTKPNKTLPLRALVIDDNKARNDLYKSVLSSRGHKSDIFNDYKKAIDAFKDEFYPLVILDSTSPEVSATDICIKIRSVEEGRKSVILILTGQENLKGFKEYLDAGADDFLQNPLNQEMLEARIAIAERRVREILENNLSSERLKRLSLIARRTDNLVVLTDERGNVEWVNESFEHITEYSMNEVIGKRPGDFLQGADTDPSTVNYMRSRLKQNLGFDVEIINYSKSGRKYWLAIEVRPIYDEAGKLTNFMAIESDITALKTVQEEIARAREQEVIIGSRIQRSLLFSNPPNNIEWADTAVLAIPSQTIDGDFFDIHTHNENCFDILIGDVMGKGVPAALVGAAAKSELMRAESHLITSQTLKRLPEPEEVVMAAHAELTKELEGLESFVTMSLARFDLDQYQVHLVNCGHTGTIHYSSQTGSCRSFQGLNLPLGVSRDEVYKQVSIQMSSGDIFVFYSDGITDARKSSGEFFGEERLTDFICCQNGLSSQELVDKLKNSILSFSDYKIPFDDITCIVVKIK